MACRCPRVSLDMTLRPPSAPFSSVLRHFTRFSGLQRRWQSSLRVSQRPKAPWTTARVLLLSAFASSLTYTYGVRSRSRISGGDSWETIPRYGSAQDLDKVSVHRQGNWISQYVLIPMYQSKSGGASLPLHGSGTSSPPLHDSDSLIGGQSNRLGLIEDHRLFKNFANRSQRRP